MSVTVAAPMAIGAATAPSDSVAPMLAAVGEIIVVAVPEVIDKNSVLPMACAVLLIKFAA